MSQSKRWCFTLNNYLEEEYALMMGEPAAKYVIIGREEGEKGTKHLQGYYVFVSNKRFGGVKKIMARAHWEVAKGTTAQNIKYCQKENNYAERGTPPRDKDQLDKDQKEKWKDVIRSAREGTTIDEYPREFIQYNSTITRLYQPKLMDIDEYTGLWYYGDPGTGKSRSARAQYPNLYEKLPNKWWDSYEKEDVVLIDDLGMDHKHMGSFLKRYCDHYPFRVEFKGGSKMIRPKTIVVTSNYRIEDIWAGDDQMIEALNRRFKNHHFEKPFNKERN